MSKKLEFLTHLDAEQGAGAKRPQLYFWYSEDVSQPSNAVMRQEQVHGNWLCQVTGACVE